MCLHNNFIASNKCMIGRLLGALILGMMPTLFHQPVGSKHLYKSLRLGAYRKCHWVNNFHIANLGTLSKINYLIKAKRSKELFITFSNISFYCIYCIIFYHVSIYKHYVRMYVCGLVWCELLMARCLWCSHLSIAVM